MKKWFVIGLIAIASSANAQKYFTKSGQIVFHSDGKSEKIEAANNKVTSIVDVPSEKLEFAVLMKAFQFEKALMQEHFNENYVESDKFPKATFSGVLKGVSAIDLTKKGSHTLQAIGSLTIHGQTKQVNVPFTIEVNGDSWKGAAAFDILLSDYKIEIPSVVQDNINNKVQIAVQLSLEPFKR